MVPSNEQWTAVALLFGQPLSRITARRHALCIVAGVQRLRGGDWDCVARYEEWPSERAAESLQRLLRVVLEEFRVGGPGSHSRPALRGSHASDVKHARGIMHDL
jgi:hypothetical protein